MTTAQDVMIDLETRGAAPGCAILSIGAVGFSTTKLGPEFYKVVLTSSCHEAGLKDDESTMVWWRGQSEAARLVLLQAEDGAVAAPLADALTAFHNWLAGHFGLAQVRIWGNGADFDNAILAYCYKAVGLELPWKFWHNRCFRTLKSLRTDIKGPKRVGTYHNALDDAKTQALHAMELMKCLGQSSPSSGRRSTKSGTGLEWPA